MTTSYYLSSSGDIDLWRQQWLAGLRAFADFMECNPDLIPTMGLNLKDFMGPYDREEREHVAAWIRALGDAEKQYTANTVTVQSKPGRFGPHEVGHVASRSAVCNRVVTTTTETVSVPDPAAPLVTREVEVEHVEWICDPLLAS